MEVIKSCDGMARALEAERRAGRSVGLVPTMGALHSGHVALIQRMAEECEVGAVSIFVNPAQFGPGEDLDKYPRALDADLRLCETAGAHYVFAPTVGEMYPAGFQTTVSVGELASRWCGASRPGHFDGVATVVAKLFAICRPHQSYFGEKDYQQLQIVGRMATDLNLGVEVVGCPTVREDDGLALSSRNAYLSDEERRAAPGLYHAMHKIDELFGQGETTAEKLAAAGEAVLKQATPAIAPEYVAVVDPVTLEPRIQAQAGDRILIAARLGGTRLIDNMALAGKPDRHGASASKPMVGNEP